MLKKKKKELLVGYLKNSCTHAPGKNYKVFLHLKKTK